MANLAAGVIVPINADGNIGNLQSCKVSAGKSGTNVKFTIEIEVSGAEFSTTEFPPNHPPITDEQAHLIFDSGTDFGTKVCDGVSLTQSKVADPVIAIVEFKFPRGKIGGADTEKKGKLKSKTR